MSINRGEVEVAGIMGPVWFIAWLFTIRSLKLMYWKRFLALLFCPYYLSVWLSM
jgi:hypothetical protein